MDQGKGMNGARAAERCDAAIYVANPWPKE